eukprot:1623238-Alexandrium_andersonii.AAC.1
MGHGPWPGPLRTLASAATPKAHLPRPTSCGLVALQHCGTLTQATESPYTNPRAAYASSLRV